MKVFSLPRYVPLLTAVLLLIANVACNKRNADIRPVLNGFIPLRGSPGGVVVVTGQNFCPDKTLDTVKINGVNALVITASPTELIILIPETVTGKMSLTIKDRTVFSPNDFSIVQNAPIVASVIPDRGLAEAPVEITGNDFSPYSKVYFGEILAESVVISLTKIAATVPAQAVTGKIRVIANGDIALSPTDFFAAPVIVSFKPKQAAVGAEVTVEGTNFNNDPDKNIIQVGNGLVTDIRSCSPTTLKFRVPKKATPGPIRVGVKGMTATSTDSFKLLIRL